MSLRQLSLTDFRNLQSTTLEFDSVLNVIYGNNASGKTSVLEAIHIISQGKSFRTTKMDQCVQHGTSGLLLFANFSDHKSGISRNATETRIKIDGDAVNRLSRLAERSPVKIINADSFGIITGPPAMKREFIDWCLFHVEHEYHTVWLLFRHALKQRNALLRSKKNLQQLDYWDTYLCQHSEAISNYRKDFIKRLSDIISNEFSDLIQDLNISMKYKAGWNRDNELSELFKTNRANDIKYGYTQFGVHRDNIELRSESYSVKQELSRGQQKRLSIALTLAQIHLVKSLTQKNVILLIDDIQSELDKTSVRTVLKMINKFDIQVFITSIELDKDLLSFHQEYKMFHVEHGIIRPVKNS